MGKELKILKMTQRELTGRTCMREFYTLKEITEEIGISQRTIYNWLENQIIPPQAIINRAGHGSKIIVDGRIIRHLKTNHPKTQAIQRILQAKYEEGKNAVA